VRGEVGDVPLYERLRVAGIVHVQPVLYPPVDEQRTRRPGPRLGQLRPAPACRHHLHRRWVDRLEEAVHTLGGGRCPVQRRRAVRFRRAHPGGWHNRRQHLARALPGELDPRARVMLGVKRPVRRVLCRGAIPLDGGLVRERADTSIVGGCADRLLAVLPAVAEDFGRAFQRRGLRDVIVAPHVVDARLARTVGRRRRGDHFQGRIIDVGVAVLERPQHLAAHEDGERAGLRLDCHRGDLAELVVQVRPRAPHHRRAPGVRAAGGIEAHAKREVGAVARRGQVAVRGVVEVARPGVRPGHGPVGRPRCDGDLLVDAGVVDAVKGEELEPPLPAVDARRGQIRLLQPDDLHLRATVAVRVLRIVRDRQALFPESHPAGRYIDIVKLLPGVRRVRPGP